MDDIAGMDPFEIFAQWYDEAEKGESSYHNAMTLATADIRGRPSARTVLLKAWDRDGFVFYTNLLSHKGRELQENPYGALLFYWKSLMRQIRIEGKVHQVTDREADAYFSSRPRKSRIGAWASRQSQPMPGGRAEFEDALHVAEAAHEGGGVARPPFWSGFRVVPRRIEFWEEKAFRLHVRHLFQKDDTGLWTSEMLYP